jgi:hypothetical protein
MATAETRKITLYGYNVDGTESVPPLTGWTMSKR